MMPILVIIKTILAKPVVDVAVASDDGVVVAVAFAITIAAVAGVVATVR